MRWLVVFAATGLLTASGLWLRVHAQAPAATPGLAFLYTATAKYEPLAWLTGGQRFPSGAHLLLYSQGKSRPLVPEFAASADSWVSFDGAHILFAGKRKPIEPWQIFEATADGENPRQITSCAEGCMRPLYLPGERLVYTRLDHGRYVLETAALDGSDRMQLSYAPGNALPTDVLRDGRVLFEAQFPLGNGNTSEMYTVYTDGSGVESYRCDHDASSSRYAGRQLASGDIVFAQTGHAARFTSALAHEVPVKLPSDEIAGDVAQVSDSEWLLSARTDANAHFAIVSADPAAATAKTVLADPTADLVQPVVLRPRAVPNRHPSALHEWDYANLLALNVYTSKLKIPEGSVVSVRLYTPGANGKPVPLGSAPVERDGSFFVQVPGDKPLQFELLDSAGRTVQREHGWYWARGGEQRICVGCHAGPERAPDNAVPAVLLKSTEPVRMTATTLRASNGGK